MDDNSTPGAAEWKATSKPLGNSNHVRKARAPSIDWSDNWFVKNIWQPIKSKTRPKDSGHYHYPPDKRREIAIHYRRDQRNIKDKEAWAQSNYQISQKTLKRYEMEYPPDT